MDEEINHKSVRVVIKREGKIPPDVEREHQMMRWVDSLYQNAMLIAAAGVLAQQGSLDKVASALWLADFSVPAGYFPDGDEGEVLDLDSEKALRLWVEREAGRIEWAMKTQGFYLATTGTLMDDSGRRLAPKSSAPRSGLRAVPDNT